MIWDCNNAYLLDCAERGVVLTCNVCGSNKIGPSGPEDNQCWDCGSWTRQRAVRFFLDNINILKPGAKVMHIAPEKGLAEYMRSVVGEGYESFDIDPSSCRVEGTKKLDLTSECHLLPSNHYDLVIHSHVMEHIFCNVTAVMWHLHRAVKDTGYHFMMLPILGGHYREDIGPLTPEDATARFGQPDHCRHYSFVDLDKTLGMVFKLPAKYDLTTVATREELDRAGIPVEMTYGFTGSTVFTFKKDDLLLRGG